MYGSSTPPLNISPSKTTHLRPPLPCSTRYTIQPWHRFLNSDSQPCSPLLLPTHSSIPLNSRGFHWKSSSPPPRSSRVVWDNNSNTSPLYGQTKHSSSQSISAACFSPLQFLHLWCLSLGAILPKTIKTSKTPSVEMILLGLRPVGTENNIVMKRVGYGSIEHMAAEWWFILRSVLVCGG